MSLLDLEPPRARAGHIVCPCEGSEAEAVEAGPAPRPALALTALGYGLNILSQTLTIAVLPIAGVTLAPARIWATLPYAATLVGALAASFVAATLADRFGRRSAFATGASLGVAGAGLAAWSFVAGQFSALCLGAFWLGTAQGFGLFYRHSAAIHATSPRRAIAIVLGSGGLAAILAPSLMRFAQLEAGPLAPAAALLCAGLVQVGIIALSLALPGRSLAAPRPARPNGLDAGFVMATAVGTAAWFGMTLLMAASPSMMSHCGISPSGVSAVISWHLLAMYAPAAIIGLVLPQLHGEWIAGIGVSLLALGAALIGMPASLVDFGLVLVLAGCGWSLAMLGSTVALHAKGRPAPALLACHDAALFIGAIGGALAAAFLV